MIVPGLLLLIGRDLLAHDPSRVLAWRLLHDPRLASGAAWLSVVLSPVTADLDRDPLALVLGTAAVGLALLYALASLLGARRGLRAAILATAVAVIIVLPTVAFIGMGIVTERPYGQDGGVVQLPLALHKIVSGESPYAADYSDSILGKEARVSEFWAPLGGNPILRHHAYLPGTHWLMMPAYLFWPGRAAFDPRVVTLLALGLAAFLASRLPRDGDLRLAAAALVALNPLVYWHLIFGANDILVVALLVLSAVLAERSRPAWGSAALGLACATKQLAWPVAPFLLFHLAGLRGLGALREAVMLRRLGRLTLVAGAVFFLVVSPLVLLDPRAFYQDIVAYNLGLPGVDKYPLGGTPGIGFANLLIYSGVAGLKDDVPLGLAFLLIAPLAWLLLAWQTREGTLARSLAAGSAAFLVALYFSRTVHANYLAIAAILLPLGFLLGTGRSADVAVIPLLLLACAVEVVDAEALRVLWDQAVAVHLPQHLSGWVAVFAPRAGSGTTPDPLGIAWGSLAAGLGVVYLVVGLLGAAPRVRMGLALIAAMVVVVVPTVVVVEVGRATGVARAQDPWIAPVLRLTHTSAGVAPREMWSGSFRRDPPRILGEARIASPGDAALGVVLRTLGGRDPRWALLVAWLVAGLLAAHLAASDHRPLVLGTFLLFPGLGLGTVYGSPGALLLVLFLAAVAMARAGRRQWSGLLAGLSAAQLPSALPAQPFALAGGGWPTWALWLMGAGWLAAAGIAAGGSLWPNWADPVGIGAPNLLALWAGAGTLRMASWILPTIAALTALAVSWRRFSPRGDSPTRDSRPGASDLAWAALFLLFGLFLAAGVGPDMVAVPLALLVLSVLMD